MQQQSWVPSHQLRHIDCGQRFLQPQHPPGNALQEFGFTVTGTPQISSSKGFKSCLHPEAAKSGPNLHPNTGVTGFRQRIFGFLYMAIVWHLYACCTPLDAVHTVLHCLLPAVGL